ncbi:WD-40 repeat-containing serine/threonine protein kinase [Reticulomyxa filosa]|uniref:WD-40 repeat-containing serine/threonine protein kinase n=1 Tax=Reticulomyxa filosa TaxID=46433 RepID=X6MNE5_RETFI|nr:WD-40 repeat-containing serine/threonine protein kinase [Reticulomyxa filosa]|eukprot:ETO14630.1 WD-40 repeat-containing serine/threonine protein kinase [Reticulomyxa filosa]
MVIKVMMLYFGIKQTEKKADLIIEHWIRSSTNKRGWIYEFNKIIAKYVKGFKLSRVSKGVSYSIDKLAFSADGRKFYLFAEDRTFEIWDIALGKKIQTFNKSNEIQDFITFVSNTNNGMQSWDIESEKKVMLFEGIMELSNAEIQFSSDGKYIAAILYSYDIRFWDVDFGKQIQRLEENNDNVFDKKYLPNRQIAVLLTMRTVSLWDMKLGKKVKEIYIDHVTKTKLSPDGRFLATFSPYGFVINCQTILIGFNSGSLLLWDIKSENDTRYYIDIQQ